MSKELCLLRREGATILALVTCNGEGVVDVSEEQWGIRSLATGRVYAWGSTQEGAEVLWAGTGTPSRYEVVRLTEEGWVEVCPATQPYDITLTPGSSEAAELALERIVVALRE